MKPLDMMEKIRNGELPIPVMKLVGFRLVEYEKGRAVMLLDARPEHANPMGTVHGGILVDVADGAMGCAMATTLDEGESFTTVELHANYFKPVWKGELRAEAKMVKRTRQLGVLECDVTDEKGGLVARIGSTCMVLRDGADMTRQSR